jgi:hypothetical protein
MLIAMVGGAALTVFLGTRRGDPPKELPPAHSPVEDPWLSSAAAAQLIGSGGELGPLFGDVTLGGPAPSPEVRARIEKFAEDNRVTIRLDVADNALKEISLEVVYGGCCGYEGADVLALKLGRRSTGVCCVCGSDTWIDDWTVGLDNGTFMHGRVRTNKVTARWEKTATLPEVLATAESLLGKNALEVRDHAGGRWRTTEVANYFHYEVPYPFVPYLDIGAETPKTARDDLGMTLVVEQSVIEEVSFGFAFYEENGEKKLKETLRARYGQPRILEEVQTWRLPTATVTMDDFYRPRVTLKHRH